MNSTALANVVTIHTSDDEIFPVKRRLLRPCIALTSVVQAGRGKYRATEGTVRPEGKSDMNDPNEGDSHYGPNDITVDVDACTFDRVLLYLEHEARGQTFHFDPLIATELLQAAQVLQIQGLQDCCERCLGRFEERVRKTPIPLQEVLERNEAGRHMTDPKRKGKRSETLLIMSGMVSHVCYYNWGREGRCLYF